jgi:hypothetical protein
VQKDQSVQELAEEVLMSQAQSLAQGSGHSLEDARQAVSDTEAGRQLRDLANGEHRHEKAQGGLTPNERTTSAYATAVSSIVACSYSDGLR